MGRSIYPELRYEEVRSKYRGAVVVNLFASDHRTDGTRSVRWDGQTWRADSRGVAESRARNWEEDDGLITEVSRDRAETIARELGTTQLPSEAGLRTLMDEEATPGRS